MSSPPADLLEQLQSSTRRNPKDEADELKRLHNEMYGRSYNGMRTAFE